jgi:1,4-dihydroxy-6-naphthoate synthase
MSVDTAVATIRIGHSPDPDDAFMFYGFASGQVTIPGGEIVHVLEDIQTLNRMAAGDDPLEVTAMSAHAYLELQDRYELLEVGTSVGRGYGPRVVARAPMPLEALVGRTVALPGPKTTATLVARGLLPKFVEKHYHFTEIMDAVARSEVDAGVIIHEGQLTYGENGLVLLADLGERFMQRHGLPLPLGVNCVRRDIEPEMKKAIAEAYRRSVEIALEQRREAVEYSLEFARGLPRETADRFVGMYVNEDSLQFNDELRAAMDVLRDRYYAPQPEEDFTMIGTQESPAQLKERVVNAIRNSESFKNELAYVARGGYEVAKEPRLYKVLEDGMVRVVFPTTVKEVIEGTVVAMTTLYDLKEERNIYAHTICAGPGVNVLLKTIHAPLGQPNPQPGVEGEKATLKFVAWKEASWVKFLNDELDLGTREASGIWIGNFWKALDRLFGGGHLLKYP